MASREHGPGRSRSATELLFRTERPEDYDAIDAVVKAAFGGGDVEVRLVHDIRSSDGYVPAYAWVAEDRGEIVGHVMLSYVDVADEQGLLLSPMSVVPGRQREGIGRDLIEAVIGYADEQGEPFVLVEGVPAYYPKVGFERATPHGFIAPPTVPFDEAWMVRLLSSDDGSLRGQVTYVGAFANLPEVT